MKFHGACFFFFSFFLSFSYNEEGSFHRARSKKWKANFRTPFDNTPKAKCESSVIGLAFRRYGVDEGTAMKLGLCRSIGASLSLFFLFLLLLLLDHTLSILLFRFIRRAASFSLNTSGMRFLHSFLLQSGISTVSSRNLQDFGGSAAIMELQAAACFRELIFEGRASSAFTFN